VRFADQSCLHIHDACGLVGHAGEWQDARHGLEQIEQVLAKVNCEDKAAISKVQCPTIQQMS